MHTLRLLLCSRPLAVPLMAAAALATGAAAAAPGPWTGTAYIRQEIRHTFQEQTYGLGRQTMQALVDLCNLRRRAYGLPATRPAEDLMAGLDLETVERFFDNGRALTRSQRYGLRLPEMEAWTREAAAHPAGMPAKAPDCSVVQKVDLGVTVLWRDGVRYELRAGKKRYEDRRHPSLTARDIDPVPQGSSPDHVKGAPCLRVRVRSAIGQSDSCLWTGYPLQDYLNFPWALESHRVVGMGPQPLVEDARTLELAVGRASPQGLFDLSSDSGAGALP